MAAASDGAEGGVDAYVGASVLVAKTVLEDVHHADAARVSTRRRAADGA